MALLAALVDRDIPAVIERMAADARGEELPELLVAKAAAVYG